MTDEYSHQDKLLSLERQVQQLTERKEQLQQELESVKSDQFIEAEARDKLHMGKPNEKVVIFPQSAHVLADTSRPSDTESTRQSWDMGHVDDWLIAIFDK